MDMAESKNSRVLSSRPKLTRQQCADYLGITVASLDDLTYRRKGPPYLKIGRRIRFDPDDVDRWLDSLRVDPVAEAG